ncbi:protein translocase subunit SecF [Candidatus Uhrbacteria bacterium CG10_big_fil_rev_8_21_14_0_10_48_11]|uniref:Protein-export membrane protein SecF n=1 Tax=Candidatus Uhrbacteria bacterium CG10_big_fil_rev_8_21_14_0_10_48_11 TaxID=1975037 RepID=A0A2M8LEF3_9BACT|nr:MAG: protein translocase subunit SecF [Candidatus Uhrbacteria bacterium CG10_big_fil_rev_8_21_14_0_10_48_11]
MRRTNINIVGYRRIAYLFSGTLVLLCALAILLPGWGLKYGIDFTGGSLMEITFAGNRPAIADISAAVLETIGTVDITPIGTNGATLRIGAKEGKALSEEDHATLLAALEKTFGGEKGDSISEERFTAIGPTIGAELRQKSIFALSAVLGAIILYIAWAFRKVSRPVPSWQFGTAAIIALFHDTIITVGIFSILGHYLGVEVNVLFITALLTLLGFSVHDTIVVFDRIRENLHRATDSFSRVVNRSLNETMGRSINTSFTTLLVLIFTLVFGGESIHYFVLALTIGIFVGTYSSIFIASPLLISWYSWKEKRRIARY